MSNDDTIPTVVLRMLTDRKGIRLSSEYFKTWYANWRSNQPRQQPMDRQVIFDAALRDFLATDLAQSSVPVIPEDHGEQALSTFPPGELRHGGGVVLQIQDTLDISTSTHTLLNSMTTVASVRQTYVLRGKDDEINFPRGMLRWTLTDGHRQIQALELQRIPQLELKTPFGCKLLIQSAQLRRGMLLLDPSTVKVLGGEVPSLYGANMLLELEKRFKTRLGITMSTAPSENATTNPPPPPPSSVPETPPAPFTRNPIPQRNNNPSLIRTTVTSPHTSNLHTTPPTTSTSFTPIARPISSTNHLSVSSSSSRSLLTPPTPPQYTTSQSRSLPSETVNSNRFTVTDIPLDTEMFDDINDSMDVDDTFGSTAVSSHAVSVSPEPAARDLRHLVKQYTYHDDDIEVEDLTEPQRAPSPKHTTQTMPLSTQQYNHDFDWLDFSGLEESEGTKIKQEKPTIEDGKLHTTIGKVKEMLIAMDKGEHIDENIEEVVVKATVRKLATLKLTRSQGFYLIAYLIDPNDQSNDTLPVVFGTKVVTQLLDGLTHLDVIEMKEKQGQKEVAMRVFKPLQTKLISTPAKVELDMSLVEKSSKAELMPAVTSYIPE
ncbi:uncharacterized protein BYT42DRAFT_275389 [Radiomyces spectabilis]|uniref:uncharacterized protein n=1 Tax=Radiomyces spectabilis TaxID=64574 RepID=UPI002221097A|nr:uncharacterized protein BYT42DRAFT_275389 [Radiomyces spectabilis]KAI8384820.1 hypothetical protein BYT42DRAFT_275389 [Radiomyces spectabilis]